MTQATLTREKVADAWQMMSADLPPADRWLCREIVIMGVKFAGVDHWDAWRELYNLGFRGRELNDFDWKG